MFSPETTLFSYCRLGRQVQVILRCCCNSYLTSNQYLWYKMCQRLTHHSHTIRIVTIWVQFSVTIWVMCERILHEIGTIWETHIGQYERFYLPPYPPWRIQITQYIEFMMPKVLVRAQFCYQQQMYSFITESSIVCVPHNQD